jgi:hypothetical protein
MEKQWLRKDFRRLHIYTIEWSLTKTVCNN